MTLELFQKTLNLKAEITPEVLLHIERIARAKLPVETGGLLLGHYADEMNKAVVDETLETETISSSDIHFERSAKNLSESLLAKFKDSGEKTIYLGEWHSHPNFPSYPSLKDLIAMNLLLVDPGIVITNPLLLIASFIRVKMDFRLFVLEQGGLYAFENK